jgi:dCTP deaminase
VLGSTLERVAISDDLVARVEGKSSLGRLGLLIHSTAGFIDAGFDGHITLELSNVANLPITIYPGMKIGQVSFMTMTTAAEKPYGSGARGSKYQGQRGPTPSRYFENFR